jgi:hypothetical protein
MLASTHRPVGRLAHLSPFDPERERRDEPSPAPAPEAASAYGCVEWFPYLDHGPAPRATLAPTRRRAARRP